MDAVSWDERYRSSELVWSRGPNAVVAETVAPWPPGRAVDLAAGEGRNAVWLAARGWEVTAVDFSAVALDKARAMADHAGVDIELVQADVTLWDPPEAVDLVVVAYLQLADGVREAVVSRAATWLRPGGHLVLVGHDKTNVTDGHGGPPSETVCYDLDATLAALAGLQIDRAEVVERVVETDDGSAVALDTVIVAHRARP